MQAVIPVQVRYAETDQMGVVYHANYFIWFELGRTAFLDQLGWNYAEFEESGTVSPVTDIQASFRRPVKYGEHVQIRTWVESYDGLRVTYGYEITTEQHGVCVSGTSQHVCVRMDTFRPTSIRRSHPELHEAYLRAARSHTREKGE